MFIARESAGADYIPVYMSVHGSIVIDIVTFICLISNQLRVAMVKGKIYPNNKILSSFSHTNNHDYFPKC